MTGWAKAGEAKTIVARNKKADANRRMGKTALIISRLETRSTLPAGQRGPPVGAEALALTFAASKGKMPTPFDSSSLSAPVSSS